MHYVSPLPDEYPLNRTKPVQEGKYQRANSVPPSHESGYSGYDNSCQNRVPIRQFMVFSDLGECRAQSERTEPRIARFESKWFKNLRKKKFDAESEDPSIPHKPPRDSTADTYLPPPLPISAKENRTPTFHFDPKMGNIVTL
jgi:hypothetical protein